LGVWFGRVGEVFDEWDAGLVVVGGGHGCGGAGLDFEVCRGSFVKQKR
jgi:hypothetical protein